MLQATSTLPIVFMAAVDPVGGGYVESLAHPGGNAVYPHRNWVDRGGLLVVRTRSDCLVKAAGGIC